MASGYVSKSLLSKPIMVGGTLPQWESAPFGVSVPPGANSPLTVSIITGYIDETAGTNYTLGMITYQHGHGVYGPDNFNTTGLKGAGTVPATVTLNPTTNKVSTGAVEEGTPVVFYNPGGASLPPQLEYGKIYYQTNVDTGADTYQLSSIKGGPAIDFSTAGTGTLLTVFPDYLTLSTINWSPTVTVLLAPQYEMQILDVIAHVPT